VGRERPAKIEEERTMSTVETVRALLAAIEAGEWERARSYLTDDYSFGGAVPEPIGPDAWLGIHKALSAAMPDFSFNARGIHEENGKVVGQVGVTGTQTRELVLPIPGMAPIAPTGKRVSLPTETITVTMRGDKLANLDVSEVAGGGVPGLLTQLGAALPAHV
jgi:predicted ester cyclase